MIAAGLAPRLRTLADRLATPKRILLAGWLWFLVYAYPGYMSYDSIWQLIQARGQEPVNDWHPPVMAFMWRYADRIVAGPFLMLAIQSVAFIVGLFAILRRVMNDRAAAIVAVLLLLAPQNVIVMAVIWKDSQMAGFLLAGIACLLVDTRNGRIAACVFLFLATAMRYNAAAPALPLVLLLWDRSTGGAWLRRYAIAACVWAAITVSAFGVNAALTETHAHPWSTSVAMMDIVGVIEYSPELDDDAQLLRMTEGVRWMHPAAVREQVRRTYKASQSFLFLTQIDDPLFTPPATDAERASVTAAWKRLVVAQPLALLRHRLAVFRAQLGGRANVCSTFAFVDWAEEAVHHRASHSALQAAWVSVMEAATRTPLFHGGMYLLLAFLLIPFCRGQRLACAVLASGITHELALLAVAPAVDYRYSHWMVLTTLLGAILSFVARRQRTS